MIHLPEIYVFCESPDCYETTIFTLDSLLEAHYAYLEPRGIGHLHSAVEGFIDEFNAAGWTIHKGDPYCPACSEARRAANETKADRLERMADAGL